MYTPHIVLATFLVAIFSLNAQSFEITGKVISDSNGTVSFANVLLYSAKDTAFVKGTSADENGWFTLKQLTPDTYLLQASYIERTSQFQRLVLNSDFEAEPLIIPSQTEVLDEVVVVAKKPTLKRLADRLVFDVGNTVVSQGNSWNILKNTPGIIVNQDELQVRSRAANVYLNGRRVHLAPEETKDFLERLPGTLIESVEIYANAPANFDAEEGAVINIITNKSVSPGYKGSVEGAFTQAIFPKYTSGTSHYFKTDKINAFANYAFSDKKKNLDVDKRIDFIDATNTSFSQWRTNDRQVRNEKSHNVNFSFDYDLDKNNSIGLTSNVMLTPNQDWERMLFATIRNGQNQIDSTFTTFNQGNEDEKNLGFDVSFVHRFKKPGTKISFNGHLTDFNDQYSQRILSSYFDGSGNFLREFGVTTNAEQDIRIVTGQVDYISPMENASLETGFKVATINSDSEVDFNGVLGNDDIVGEALSDEYQYKETLYAVYASFLKNWDNWSLKAGLRAELTDAKGVSLTLNEVNRQNFFEPFPTLYLLYSPHEKHSFTFDYGRNVHRPRYNDLNPFLFFYNENDFEEGNPRLQPNFSNNFNINYSLNNEFFVDLYYRDNGNYISNLVFQENDRLTLRELKQNVLSSNSYGLDVTLSKSILNPWFLYAYASLYYEDETFIAVESGNRPFKNAIDGFYLFLANYLTLSADGSFTGEISFSHMSRFILGSYVSSPQTNLTVGLRKSLWKGRAILTIATEDLLDRAVSTYASRYLNQNNSFFSQPETQFIRFGFQYNFGNFRLEGNQRDITKAERDRI